MTQHKPTLKMLASLWLLLLVACGSSGLGESQAGGSGTAVPASQVATAETAAPMMRTAELARFRKVNDWGSGFTAEVTIKNTTDTTIRDWQLSFTMPANISSIWNATELGRNGNVHRVVAKSYNNLLAPGQAITLGFNASPGGAAVTASDLVLEWPDDGGTGSGGSGSGSTGGTGLPATGEVSYSISSNWGSGFGAQVEIRNPGSAPLENWTLEFRLPANIDSLWNADILSRSGDTYKVGPKSYNRTVPAGGSVSFGFNGSPGGGSANAGSFVLSGQPVSTPGPDPTPEPTPGPTPEPTPNPTPEPTPGPNPNPPAAGFYSTDGARIVDSQGTTVYFKGINWFGLETETSSPHGLWTRSMDSMLDQMTSLGYDTLRVPYSNDALKPGEMARSIDYSKNPDLQGKTALQVLDALVAKAGQRNMRIILDRHCPTKDVQSDLWYTAQVSEEQWISDWEMLARRYKGNPTVIGADLHNEPYGRATWGSGQLTTDWRLAAQRCGNRILAANPDWLIIVEGVEKVDGHNYWWGGNLRNAGAYPVTLAVPNKVVYSTHDYPATVHNQSWFSAPNYPANLAAIWDANWGYLLKGNIAPVLVGEFGTKYATESDRVWLGELVDYIKDNGAQFTYWCWNENSRDTGGILKSDWNSVETAKQAALNPLMQR